MNRLFARTILALVGATNIYAAETATLSGLVRDPSDAAIVGAEVTIRANDTGASRRVTTNDSGLFSAPSLQPGVYTITITALGFKTLESKDVRLGVAEVRQIDFTMAIGEVNQSVVVEGSASLINTSDGSVGVTISRELVANLPLNGRTFQQLIVQAPGVNIAPASNDGGQFNVNGQRATTNYMAIDGVSANIGVSLYTAGGSNFAGNAAGGTNSLASVDAVEEFRLLTSTYAPEYGRSPGGQIIIRTRSGTNEFHGTAFEYFRNNALDANDWFANANGKIHAPLRFNDFGGVLGGPMIHSKTFFFLSYEGQQMRQPVFVISTVPSIASRQAAVPATQGILNAFPVPNGPVLSAGQAQFAAGYSNLLTSNATSVRLDHIFGPKLTAFARYNYAPSDSLARNSGYALSMLTKQSFETQTLTAGVTYVISPRLVSNFHFNVSDNAISQAFSLDAFGGAQPFSGSSLLQTARLNPTSAYGGISMGFIGGSLLVGTPGFPEQRQINIVEGLDLRIGSHQLKFGVDDRRLLPLETPFQLVSYTFSSVANVITNQSALAAYAVQKGTRGQINNLSLYIQDTWRASSQLTLTYGVRWEVNTPPCNLRANNGNYVSLNPFTLTLSPPGVSLWDTQYANFAPRIGVGYQLRQAPGREMVLRAGAGLFYDTGTGTSTILPWVTGFPNSVSNVISGASFPLTPSQAILPTYDLSNPPTGQTFYAYPRNLSLPRSWQWNAAVEQSLGRSQTVTVSYVSSLGRRLLYEQNYQNLGPKAYAVNYTDNEGSSNYQSLQVQYQRRLSRGITATGAYTWAHSLDDLSSDFGSLIPPTTQISAKSNWSSSDYDVRQALNAAVSVIIPHVRNSAWLSMITKGWGVDAIVVARSALPVNVLVSQSLGYGTQLFRPDLVPSVPLYMTDPDVAGGQRFNKAAFAIVTTRQGDLGRNVLRGFDLVQSDLSLRRSINLSERFQLLFRSDFFNVFNHPNFANPVPSLQAGTFGMATTMLNGATGGLAVNPLIQTGGPRSIQLSLKLMF